MQEDLWVNALIGFSSTFFGVLLAFGLTFWYDQKKKHDEEKENRLKIIRTIKRELEENLEPIKSIFRKRIS